MEDQNGKNRSDPSQKGKEIPEDSKAQKRLEELKQKFDNAGDALQKMIDKLSETPKDPPKTIDDLKNEKQ